jgi:hypothetical protein
MPPASQFLMAVAWFSTQVTVRLVPQAVADLAHRSHPMSPDLVIEVDRVTLGVFVHDGHEFLGRRVLRGHREWPESRIDVDRGQAGVGSHGLLRLGVGELRPQYDEGGVVAGRGHRLGEGSEVGSAGRPERLDPLLLVILDVGGPVLHRNRGLEEVDHLPTLSLCGELVLRLFLEDRWGVGPTHAGHLDRIRVGPGQRSKPPCGYRVCIGAARVDLVGGKNRGVRDDIAGDLPQPALLTDRDG